MPYISCWGPVDLRPAQVEGHDAEEGEEADLAVAVRAPASVRALESGCGDTDNGEPNLSHSPLGQAAESRMTA